MGNVETFLGSRHGGEGLGSGDRYKQNKQIKASQQAKETLRSKSIIYFPIVTSAMKRNQAGQHTG